MLAPIAAAPEILSTLPSGTALSGSVLSAEQAGNLQVMTKYGRISLATSFALPEGAKVALQIREGGQAQLQVVGPKVIAGSQAPLRPAAETPVQLSSQVLTATLESSLAVRPTGGGIAASAQPGSAAAQLPAILRQLPSGAQFQVQVTALPPGAQATTANPLTAPQAPAAATTNPVLQGNVVTTSGQGGTPAPSSAAVPSGAGARTLLRSSLGVLSLNEPLKLPPGAKVEIQVLLKSLPQALPATAPLEATLQPTAMSGLAWPSLETLARRAGEGQIPAALAAQVLQRVPSAGAQLSSNLLFLLSALNAGQVGSWLGRPTLELFQREGHGDLLNRLESDLAQAGRLADSSGGEWRSLVLPFLDEGQLRQLRLFLRRQNPDEEQDGKDGSGADATRFLLEIELRRTGDLQADGLIRAKLFDLILRTRRPFSRPMREEITRIFTESNHSLGLAGQILFEASDTWQPAAAKAGGLQSSPDLMI